MIRARLKPYANLHHIDGRDLHYKDRVLTCTAFKTLPMAVAAEDEKTIDARVDRLAAASASGPAAALGAL